MWEWLKKLFTRQPKEITHRPTNAEVKKYGRKNIRVIEDEMSRDCVADIGED